MEDAGGGKSEKNAKKSEKFDTSFKKVVGGSLKLKGVEFKGSGLVVSPIPSHLCTTAVRYLLLRGCPGTPN